MATQPTEYRCAHCGEIITGRMHLNPWLPWPSYEHWPPCEQTADWYTRNTWQTVGGRILTPEAQAKEPKERV